MLFSYLRTKLHSPQVAELTRQLEEARRKQLEYHAALIEERFTRSKITPMDILKDALGEDLSWFPYDEITDPGEKKRYREYAKEILESPLIKNEVSFIKSNWAKKALLDINDVSKKAEHLEKMCWMIIGIHEFMLRLQEIAPSKVVNVNEDEDSD